MHAIKCHHSATLLPWLCSTGEWTFGSHLQNGFLFTGWVGFCITIMELFSKHRYAEALGVGFGGCNASNQLPQNHPLFLMGLLKSQLLLTSVTVCKHVK
jgi:hypothetical protein